MRDRFTQRKTFLSFIIILVLGIILILGGVYFYVLKENHNQSQKRVVKRQVINSTTTETGNTKTSTSVSYPDVIEANNKFALDYYSRLSQETNKNIFFSPCSISNALAMVYEGARGKTAQQIESVFHFPVSKTVRRQGYLNLINEMNKGSDKYQLRTANALWAQNNYPFLKQYFDLINKYYGGQAVDLDFLNQTEKSRKTINDWVAKQTSGKIKDLIPKGDISPVTKLVLTNAIYFKGKWEKSFDKKATEDGIFKVDRNNSVKVPTMRRTDDKAIFNYMENNTLQMIEIPYSGKDLSMFILLPKHDNIKGLESALNLKNLSQWRKEMEEQRVMVFIPKFKFETKYFMKKDLSNMGMPIAFSNIADFSGMTGKKDLTISKVIHQTYIDVDEEGTEAAAATAVGMKLSMAPGEKSKTPIIFRANHPFIFLIRQNKTGNILFMGRMVDPSQDDKNA